MTRPGEAEAELGEILSGVRGHLSAGIELARQGLAVAERDGNNALELFFHRCLHELGRACADARHLKATKGASATPEQLSDATFAPGDGATDADVTPDAARDKPGTWPAY